MEDIKKYIEKIKRLAINYIEIATKHRFILLFVILGTAIAFALLRTQSFIDITRNEQRYTEETSKIKYNLINEETLKSFAAEQIDTDVQVDSKFDPTRNNPFID